MITLLALLAGLGGGAMLAMAGVDWRGVVGVWMIVTAWHPAELANEERRMLRRWDAKNDKWLFNDEDRP